jgi:hypothetical protein
MEKKEILDALEHEAKQPAGPCGRVCFGLFWHQQLREAAEQAFGEPTRTEVLAIGDSLAAA